MPSPLIVAINRGDLDGVRRALADPNVDPAANENRALILAVRNTHDAEDAKIVQLLLADPRVDPTARDNDAMDDATRATYRFYALKALVEDGRANPASATDPHFIAEKSYLKSFPNIVYEWGIT